MPASFAEQDRPFLGWGQLVLPPLVAGVSCAAFGFPIAPLAVVFAVLWAWKLCGDIAEWRYTVRWEASLRDEDARPADDYARHFHQGIFVVEVMVIALAVMVPVLWPWLPSRGQQPTWWNFQRLRVGMTLEEVEAIMGPPTEDLDTAALSPTPGLGPKGMDDFKNWQGSIARLKKWRTGRYTFSCDFDKAGRLTRVAYLDWKKVGEL